MVCEKLNYRKLVFPKEMGIVINSNMFYNESESDDWDQSTSDGNHSDSSLDDIQSDSSLDDCDQLKSEFEL